MNNVSHCSFTTPAESFYKAAFLLFIFAPFQGSLLPCIHSSK